MLVYEYIPKSKETQVDPRKTCRNQHRLQTEEAWMAYILLLLLQRMMTKYRLSLPAAMLLYVWAVDMGGTREYDKGSDRKWRTIFVG